MKTIRTNPYTGQTSARWGLLRLGLVLLVAEVAWSGCKPKVAVIPDVDPVGSYTLASVNGKQVPCSVTHEGASPTIKAGTFVINQDGTCSSTVSFSMPGGNDSSRQVKATYKRAGSKLTMQWEGAGITTGTVAGDTFTMNNEGMIFAYRK